MVWVIVTVVFVIAWICLCFGVIVLFISFVVNMIRMLFGKEDVSAGYPKEIIESLYL